MINSIARIAIAIVCLLLASCGSLIKIEGGFYGLYGYQKVATNQNPDFIKYKDTICNLTFSDVSGVLAVHGKQIKSCLQDSGITLVYMWQPRCGAMECVPPYLLQKFCDEQTIDLFVIASYYDLLRLSDDHRLARPLFGINSFYYKTGLTGRYTRKFLNDLLGADNVKEDLTMYYLFKHGQLVGSSNNVYSLFQ